MSASETRSVSDAERHVLASVYAFVLACAKKNKAAGVTSTNGDDAKGSANNEVRAESILPPGQDGNYRNF